MSWQGLVVVPGGQVDPAAAEAAVVMTSLSPVSGLFTVTVKVMTADAPGGQVPGPGQGRGWCRTASRTVAAASPL